MIRGEDRTGGEGMNRLYEAFVILKAAGTDAELAQAVAHVEEPIKKLGGQIESAKNFGRRRLAYRIARQSEGYYHLLHFRMAPEQVGELKRLLRLNDTIVRFLILSGAAQQPAGATSAATS